MKIFYPLSLKVSLWLMLNLLLLAATGLGVFVASGGLRWDALVSGPSGERLQSLANMIAGEAAAAAAGPARDAVLKRFSTAYQADFSLFNPDAQIAGHNVELPEIVRAQLDFRGGRNGLIGPPGDRRPLAGRGDAFRGGEFEGPRRREPPPDKGGPPEFAEKGRREPPPDGLFGRFLIHSGNPVAYWVGLRVPFATAERPRGGPARLIIRVSSLWSLLHLLNLQSWVLAATGAIALSVLFWLPLVHHVTRSISQLTTATEQIAEGRFETRILTRRHDELGLLGDAVNRMALRLDAQMKGQKRFLGDVAHELCSPLARLQMTAGILAEQSPPEIQPTVNDLREEVQQMSALVNELLAFTKAGLQPREVALGAVAVAPLAHAVLAREDVSGRVTLHCSAEVTVKADRDLLARALSNLVRNALRYGGETGAITLTATAAETHVSLAVADEGPGVPAGDIDRLGEPFFRPELARTRESGGVGLGLAIVRSSITSCGGEVRFTNLTPIGFCAELRLARI